MQLTILASRDPRIHEELTLAFPNAPELVEYLRFAIISLGGTRGVATLFVRGLQHLFTAPDSVCDETVLRLSVHTDTKAVERIDRVLEKRSGYFEDCIVFGQWLHAQIKGDSLEARHGIVSGSETDYMRLYICAYAMLVGISIDPRKQPNQEEVRHVHSHA